MGSPGKLVLFLSLCREWFQYLEKHLGNLCLTLTLPGQPCVMRCMRRHWGALGEAGSFRWLPTVEGSIVFRGSTRLCRGTALECKVCMVRPQGLQERERERGAWKTSFTWMEGKRGTRRSRVMGGERRQVCGSGASRLSSPPPVWRTRPTWGMQSPQSYIGELGDEQGAV